MARLQLPEYGTMVVALVLILAIVFAGYWINAYAQGGARPWGVAGWFGIAAGAVVLIGIANFLRRR